MGVGRAEELERQEQNGSVVSGSRAHLKDQSEVKREKQGVEGAKRIIEVVPAWLQ